jgi:hypothetical protein
MRYSPYVNKGFVYISVSKIYICYLPAARSILKKYFPEVSEAARGRRPRDASEAEGKYFLVRTDLNGK